MTTTRDDKHEYKVSQSEPNHQQNTTTSTSTKTPDAKHNHNYDPSGPDHKTLLRWRS